MLTPEPRSERGVGVSSRRFTQTTWRAGYDQREVDQLLALVAADLALPLAARTLPVTHLVGLKFAMTWLGAGYDPGQVDAALVELGDQRTSPLPGEPPVLPPATPPVLPASADNLTAGPDGNCWMDPAEYRPDTTF